MSHPGTLTDPTPVPRPEDLAATVGETRPLWDRLAEWIGSTYGVAGEPLFTDRESGWVLRFRRSGRALLTLSPWATGGFGALVVVGPSAWDAVEVTPLSPAVRSAWDGARPYPDGRWLFLEVTDAGIVEDIQRLVALKSTPPRRPRRVVLTV